MTRFLRGPAAAAVAACVLTAGAALGESVWIEGEKPARHTFFRHSWYDKVSKDIFSGKEWLSHYRKDRPGEAAYSFDVQGGRYRTFYYEVRR
jgi:hypothetical protein